MEEFVLDLTNGNAAEVKVTLASVIAALAIYQLVLAAIGYGKIRVPFLANPAALRGHRAIGDTIFALAIITGGMCLSVYGFEDDGGIHAIAGAIVLGALVVRPASSGPTASGSAACFRRWESQSSCSS